MIVDFMKCDTGDRQSILVTRAVRGECEMPKGRHRLVPMRRYANEDASKYVGGPISLSPRESDSENSQGKGRTRAIEIVRNGDTQHSDRLRDGMELTRIDGRRDLGE